MANELTARASLTFVKGNEDAEFPLSFTVDITGTKCLKNTQTIANTATALELGDITDPGFLAYYNEDEDNFIEIRNGENGADVIKISPACGGFVELATNAPYAIADTAACELRYMVIQV